jgi:protein TonB
MHAMLDLPPDERRFIAAGIAASVALHAAALVLGPRVAHEHPLEPPRVLSVVLPEPASPPAEAMPPPASPPPAPRVAARPPPRIAHAPKPPPPAAVPPVATAPAESSPAPPIRDAGPSEERPAAAPAPAVVAVPPPALSPPALSPPALSPPALSPPALSPPDFRAAYLRNPPPGYPAAARRNGEEGTVMLRVLVSAEGAPREVALERSSGSSLLDATALATVKTWRFSPARRGGEVQEAWVLVPIVFRLEPRG